MTMYTRPTPFRGLWLLRPTIYSDNRGFFMESFRTDVMRAIGFNNSFIQDNHSYSTEIYTLRGLHFQKHPYAQSKLIRVLKGSIFDVVVDLRREEKTFGKLFGIRLSADNYWQMLIPTGFAHGFITLKPHTEVLYKVDAPYAPAYEGGIRWNDPTLAIPWPIPRYLSEKDQNWPSFRDVIDTFT